MTYQDIVVLLNHFITEQEINLTQPMLVDESLITHVGRYLSFSAGKHITVVPIETSNRIILGKLRHFEGGVEILLNEVLNPCWTRFVLAKEIFHLIMSKDGEGITKDIDKLVEGLYNVSFGFSDDVDHELLAILFAADYILPYDLTQEKLKNASILSSEIAEEFKAPKNVVTLLRSHIKMRDDAYKDMKIEHELI